MSLKYEEKEIDGISFGTTQFAAMKGLELLGQLAQTIGPALGVLSSADPNMELEALAPVLAKALMGLKPNDLGNLALNVLEKTTATLEVNGKLKRVDIIGKDAFDQVFSGRLMTMFKAVLHALKVNYADFGLGGATNAPVPAPVTETE